MADANQLAVRDARAFIRQYVDLDGRVVRRDQGGDTVSEGQGYGLLLAYATDDRSTFTRIWGWTAANLQRSDGLFSYRWSNGHVVSSSPAADADVQIAWALDLAALRWHEPAYSTAARRIAASVAASEVGYDDQGRPTLAAGPWALASRSVVSVEPGYWSFAADDALARLTRDHRWQDLAAADLYHLNQLSSAGTQLPADWAQIGGGQDAHPVSAPGQTSPPVSGQDGMRAMVWATCDQRASALEVAWWRLQAASAAAAPLSRSISGAPAATDQSPLAAVASAASARAAGDAAASTRLLAEADAIAQRYPTYYGQAWSALGRIIVDTTLLPGC
jgi:endoglucanase